MRVKINPEYIIAVEEKDSGDVCIVTPVKAFCTSADRVKIERDMLNRIYYVVEL